ncbi:hypothetical protein BKA61DRAFT_603355 [Leptodontidium sp. MPI-SDFR-AT-0119]|nr:hypothetical protein BKA61DRAFT_603355 [Leptodontidium sp. MPI-SDFR-AT-0119]
MLHLRSTWTFLFFTLAAHLTDAVSFAPAPTQADQQTPVLRFESLPTITGGALRNQAKARQVGEQNPICGWINGNGASAVSCGASFYCATQQSFVGCCEISSCAGIVTTCYDILGSICDAACQQNVANLVCASPLPYCATYGYSGGSTGYGCAVATGYKVSVLLSVTTSDGGSLSLPTPSSTTSSPASSSTTTSTTSPVSPSTNNGLGGGAIAGIVIGAIAAIALIGILVFLILRRHRKQPREMGNTAQQMQGTQQDQYAMQDYRGEPYTDMPVVPSPGYKVESPQRSPPPGNMPSPPSPYWSENSRTPRNSQQIYSGPLMPEMMGDASHVRGDQ